MDNLNSSPDILEVISDLSNDEVFTPPRVANMVLDLLPSEVWGNPNLRWLEPGCKTGVFLREITKRLLIGLEDAIPNETERLNHILKKMIFGVAVTSLTSKISRRTLYCSKDASSEKSVVESFTEIGNVWYEKVSHLYSQGKCTECGASENQIEQAAENYAYAFIHKNGKDALAKELKMNFDVVIGNPPYQMADGGHSASAKPLYNLFVEEALRLNPKYIAMIIPARWYSGGKGLNEFRNQMLNEVRITKLVDIKDASQVFPQVEIKGGVCYFLIERDSNENCKMASFEDGVLSDFQDRNLSEYDILVRDGQDLSILRKVLSASHKSLSEQVSKHRPFGLRTFYAGDVKQKPGYLTLYQNGGIGYISPSTLEENQPWVDKHKLLVPRATYGNEKIPSKILPRAIYAGPNSACTETYLVVGPFSSKAKADWHEKYLATKFVRFLVGLRKNTQDNKSETFKFVPDLHGMVDPVDEDLYKFFGLSDLEIAIIDEKIESI